MRVSGKLILIIIFGTAIGLGLWARSMGPVGSIPQKTKKEDKSFKGYRPKVFLSVDQARAIAEKKINENTSYKNIITRVDLRDDGWLFHYESEKYMMSGRDKDRIASTPVLVRKDGTAEFFVDLTKK